MTRIATVPGRPALRYFGGKWRLAPWIIRHLPAHALYCEPYAGGASVFFRKTPADISVLNDSDSAVVNFFRVLRERTDELVRAIELTPFSREEWDLAYSPSDDALESARRLYIRSWQSRGGPRTQWKSCWRYVRASSSSHRANPSKEWGTAERLRAVADRLRGVFIEHDDALAVIRRYDGPGALFLCDPPYLPNVRGERWATHAYRHEADEDHHRALGAVLNDIRGMAIVCGYPSALYDEIYPGWRTVTTLARTDTERGIRTECLWISPAAEREAARQGSLF